MVSSQESWDAGQVWKELAVSSTVHSLWHHLGLKKLELVEVVYEAGPPGASCFEDVWDADIKGILGPDKMLEQMYNRSRR